MVCSPLYKDIMINKISKRISQFFKWLYIKLAKINDTPQKIALGFGLGVFLGIIPFAGPIAALVLSSFLKINRASALLGSLLTNTWISIVTFMLAVKVGSAVTGADRQSISSSWTELMTHFHWGNLFELAVLKIAFPVMAGYFIVSLALALSAYVVMFVVIKYINKRRQAAQ